MRLRVLAFAVPFIACASAGVLGAISVAQAQQVPVANNSNINDAPGVAASTGITLSGSNASLYNTATTPYAFALPGATWTITSQPSGSTITLNDGSGNYGYFNHSVGTYTLNLVNSLTITGGNNGNTFGGAFYVGTLDLSSSSGNITLSGNSVTGFGGNGGAICSSNVNLSASGAITLSGNSAVGTGGGARGGAIYATSGNVNLSTASGNISLSGNSVTDTDTVQGGAIYAKGGGNVSLSAASGDIILSGNSATSPNGVAQGGAIYTIDGNVSLSAASGAISLSGNSVTGGGGGEGGAIWAATSAGTVPHDVSLSAARGISLSGNSATTTFRQSSGGAITSTGNVSLSTASGDINLSGNSIAAPGVNRVYGGAIYAGYNVSLSAPSGSINLSENSATGTTGYRAVNAAMLAQPENGFSCDW